MFACCMLRAVAARATLRMNPLRSITRREIPVVAPYRLDLTVSALRRLSTNVVDLLTPEGQYVRALSGIPQL